MSPTPIMLSRSDVFTSILVVDGRPLWERKVERTSHQLLGGEEKPNQTKCKCLFCQSYERVVVVCVCGWALLCLHRDLHRRLRRLIHTFPSRQNSKNILQV